MRTFCIAIAAMLLLSACVQIYFGRADHHAEPIACKDGYTFDQDGAITGCVDFSEPPDDNHYPTCPWQLDMPCENVI